MFHCFLTSEIQERVLLPEDLSHLFDQLDFEYNQKHYNPAMIWNGDEAFVSISSQRVLRIVTRGDTEKVIAKASETTITSQSFLCALPHSFGVPTY